MIFMARLEEKIRQIWIIHILLDCKKWKQRDILMELLTKSTDFDKEYFEPIIDKIRKKLYKSLGFLDKEGIIERENDKITKDKWVWLKQDSNSGSKALHKVLNKLSDPLVMGIEFNNQEKFEYHYNFIRSQKNHLIKSEFAKKTITNDLVRKFETALNISLKYEEREVVLTILQLSPLALLNSFKTAEMATKLKKYGIESSSKKEKWLTNLQNDLYTEINYLNYKPPFQIKVEQKIETTITDIEHEKEFSIKTQPVIKLLSKPLKLQKYNRESSICPLGTFREAKKK